MMLPTGNSIKPSSLQVMVSRRNLRCPGYLTTGLIFDTFNRRSQELIRMLTYQVLTQLPRKAPGADRDAAGTA